MTPASSFAPLRYAVTRALTASTGKPRALSDAHLFARATAADARQRAATAKGRPLALVVVKNGTADVPGGVLQGMSIQRDVVLVEITLWYYAGSELFSRETDAALDRIDGDTPMILAALCEPAALATDPDGNPTGIDGGSLRVELWSSQGPDLLPVPEGGGDRRVFRVVHRFSTGIEIQQPT